MIVLFFLISAYMVNIHASEINIQASEILSDCVNLNISTFKNQVEEMYTTSGLKLETLRKLCKDLKSVHAICKETYHALELKGGKIGDGLKKQMREIKDLYVPLHAKFKLIYAQAIFENDQTEETRANYIKAAENYRKFFPKDSLNQSVNISSQDQKTDTIDKLQEELNEAIKSVDQAKVVVSAEQEKKIAELLETDNKIKVEVKYISLFKNLELLYRTYLSQQLPYLKSEIEEDLKSFHTLPIVERHEKIKYWNERYTQIAQSMRSRDFTDIKEVITKQIDEATAHLLKDLHSNFQTVYVQNCQIPEEIEKVVTDLITTGIRTKNNGKEFRNLETSYRSLKLLNVFNNALQLSPQDKKELFSPLIAYTEDFETNVPRVINWLNVYIKKNNHNKIDTIQRLTATIEKSFCNVNDTVLYNELTLEKEKQLKSYAIKKRIGMFVIGLFLLTLLVCAEKLNIISLSSIIPTL